MLVRRVFSMGTKRAEYANRLENRSYSIIFHLLYLCFFPSNISYTHWRGESYGFFPKRIEPFKGSPVRYPKADFLFYALYDWIHDSDGLMKDFKDDIAKKGLIVPHTFDFIYWESMKKIGLIMKDVCTILANEHRITQDQYFGILSKHGL